MKNWLKRYILEGLEARVLITWRAGFKLKALIDLIILILAIIVSLPFDLVIDINKGLNEISKYIGGSASSATSTTGSIDFGSGSGGGDDDINEIDAMNYYSSLRTNNNFN